MFIPKQAPGVKLAGLGLDETGDGPKWVHVANEGEFKGYAGGNMPFTFTRGTFEQIVANIKSHPAFVAGADGVGTADVIPWDFNHASEQSSVVGTLPSSGAPAQGWTIDLEVRNSPNGKAELWALTRFLEPARTYVKQGAMQWASVAVTFEAIHPVSGENIGAIVTSIALTNTPFIEGMNRLVASKSSSVNARRFYEAAESPEEAVSMMRSLFGLSDTQGLPEIEAEIAKIAQWIELGTAPLGIELDEIVGSMRTILNLPALTPASEVLQAVTNIIPALLEEEMLEGELASDVAASKNGDTNVELVKILASLLGVRENEDAVKSEVENLINLRKGMKKSLGTDRDGTSALLEAADQSVAAADKLSAVAKALGVEDVSGAIARVTEVMEQAAELQKVMPELKGLRAAKAEAEEKEIEDDVDAAIAASKSFDESHKPMLLLFRKTEPDAFQEKYGASIKASKTTPPTQAQQTVANNPTLLSNLSVQNGQQVVLGAGKSTEPVVPPAQLNGQNTINLNDYAGRNKIDRCKTYLASTKSGWKNLTYDQQFELAFQLSKQPHVILGS